MAEQTLFADLDDREIQEFLTKLKTKLAAAGGSGEGLTAFVNRLHPIAFADVIGHFNKEEGSEGPWPRWSKEHEAKMIKMGKGGNKILQDSGRLRNSFVPSKTHPKDTIRWVNPAQTRGGFGYAFAHDTGGPRLPKRDFMWLSEKALNTVSDATFAFLLED